jgi:hypothetical protein
MTSSDREVQKILARFISLQNEHQKLKDEVELLRKDKAEHWKRFHAALMTTSKN